MLFYHVQTKDFKIHSNQKISDKKVTEVFFFFPLLLTHVLASAGMYLPLCLSRMKKEKKKKKNVPGVGHTLHDGLVSPHGYTGVLWGDDDRRGDGVRGSSNIYHRHRSRQKDVKKEKKIHNLCADLRLKLRI